mgnify:CR=1 FL=1
MLARFLSTMGHGVEHVASGSDVLRLLAEKPFDLMVLDLRLPGVSGIELLQKLRGSGKFRELPVIIITGVYRGERYAEAARRLGVRHYLEKPFGKEAFIAAIDETIASIPAAGGEPSLLELLISLYREGGNGTLMIGDSPPVAILNGEPAGFASAGNGEFPDFLVARGKISREEKGLFLESGEDRLFLIQAGIISYDDLVAESQLFLAKLLMENLPLKQGVSFSREPCPVQPLLTLSTPRLLYDAIRFYPQQFGAEGFFRSNSALYPARNSRYFRLSNLIAMEKVDIDILAEMDGRKTLAELASSAAGARRVALLLSYLHLLGMVTLFSGPAEEAVAGFPQKCLFNSPLKEEPVMEELTIGFDDVVGEVADEVVRAMGEEGMAAPLSEKEIGFEQAVQREYVQIKDRDYYAIFGMSQGRFSFNTLKETYFAKMREYSPERFMELSGTTSNMAQEILAIYAEAYNTLSNVVAKERYDEMLNNNMTMGIDGKQDGRLHARIQLQSGKVFLEMEEYENAEKALQEAYTLDPDNGENAAYLAWAIYSNPANARSRSARERVQALLTKSLQIAKSAEAFAFRGWLLLDEGRDGLAEGEFLKALKLNAKEPTARKGMKMIADKREGEKKGLLKRFFG